MFSTFFIRKHLLSNKWICENFVIWMFFTYQSRGLIQLFPFFFLWLKMCYVDSYQNARNLFCDGESKKRVVFIFERGRDYTQFPRFMGSNYRVCQTGIIMALDTQLYITVSGHDRNFTLRVNSFLLYTWMVA